MENGKRVTRAPIVSSLKDFQALHAHWRKGIGQDKESPSDINLKLAQEITELNEALRDSHPFSIANEAADIFMFALAMLSTFGIPLETLLTNNDGNATFNQLQTQASSFAKDNGINFPQQLLPSLFRKTYELFHFLETNDFRRAITNITRVIFDSCVIISLLNFPLDRVIMAKHNRNEHKYNRHHITNLINGGLGHQAMELSRDRWGREADAEFLRMQLEEK